ncbi:F-box/FBD/LRR-repeat protein At5g56420-like [Silene latifolia]|uniref:F-box/FBD/LRR-repeat protein At5g56420-like n=1 Tax=Silene latifolia TaxID=37657 RepID=UPI003D778C3D
MKTEEYTGDFASIKKLKLHDSTRVPGSRMSDHLSGLPDEILCYILSFMTLRDSVRARLLSTRWRYLSDYRPALKFDALNVLGSEKAFDKSYESKFVRAVDQFLDILKGSNLSALKVQFCLGMKQASHIDRWVETGIRMEIKDLELNFSHTSHDETYVLSDQLFHSLKAFLLKRLRLVHCVLTCSSGCINWISQLTTLELFFVPLHEKDIMCVLSGGLNLKSLSLVHCFESSRLCISVELPHLKKLMLYEDLREIELHCPNLETLEYDGRVRNFKFSHVPILTKVSLSLNFHHRGGSLVFDSLARHAPMLQELSLCVMTELQPMPGNYAMTCLKRLDIDTHVPSGFDLFTITYLLNASPFLEALHLELRLRHYTKQSPRREYSDFPHLKLKEVKFDGFQSACNEMELSRYLLKNAVALQRMVIACRCDCSSSGEAAKKYCSCSSWGQVIATTLLQDIKTTAELVILGVLFNAPNLVDNGISRG